MAGNKFDDLKEVAKDLMRSIELAYGKSIFNEEEWENTPKRVAKMIFEFARYQKENLKKFKVFPNPGYDQLIVVGPIKFYSLCSHHLLPYFGEAWVGYLPDKYICGLSKISRIVKALFMQPSIQEERTNYIADFLFEKLKPKFLMIVVKGKHLCMHMRGVKENDGWMITSAIRSTEPKSRITSIKEEFLEIIKYKK